MSNKIKEKDPYVDLYIEAGEGNESSFEKIYKHFYPVVYGTTIKMLSNKSDAEDATIMTFAKLWKSAPKYTALPNYNLKSWVMMITKQHVYNEYRRRGRKPTFSLCEHLDNSEYSYGNDLTERTDVLEDSLSEKPHKRPDVVAETKDIFEKIQILLRTLPEEQQQAMIFKNFKDFTCAEVVEAMELPQHTVNNYVYRSRVNMRKRMEKYYGINDLNVGRSDFSNTL